jgi:GNAT superfamily N-acetyltransferase
MKDGTEGFSTPSERLVEYARQACRDRGVGSVRLDCAVRPGLCAVYERMGFERVKISEIHAPRLGWVKLAYYKLDV